MKMSVCYSLLLATMTFSPMVWSAPAKEWIDGATGHRIMRLSTEAGSASLYFHQNSYTPQGDKMIITVPDGIAVVDLHDWSIKALVKGSNIQALFTGRKSRTVYYTTRDQSAAGGPSTVFGADIDTGKIHKIAALDRGAIGSINADETLLLGSWADQESNSKGENRLNQRINMEIFIIDIKNGSRKTILRSRDWLGHLQFSPSDPSLIMYCHEGPWDKVDRIWKIHTDGTKKNLIHKRTMPNEIAGHEFFSPDGKWIWYDLQTPRSKIFWLAGYEIATGRRKWFQLDRNMWSVHYNQSPDMRFFSGDGGDRNMTGRAPDGKYIYLFTPHSTGVSAIAPQKLEKRIKIGRFTATRIADMRKNAYRLEPNATFTPDSKWLIFRSNIEGENHVYAAEVEPIQ